VEGIIFFLCGEVLGKELWDGVPCYTRSTEGRSAASPSTVARKRGAEAYDAGTDSFVLVLSVRKIGCSVERFINVAYLTTFDA